MTKRYFVYTISTKTCKLYTGMTNNIERRVYEHKNKIGDGFTLANPFFLGLWLAWAYFETLRFAQACQTWA
jgi:predicted GIY-YIG superfamily endonuclease